MAEDIGQSVRDRLQNTAQVALIAQARIYADILPAIEPKRAFEAAVVVQVPTSQAHEDLSGTNRVYQSQVHVLAYGRTRTEANQLAAAIRNYALPADLRGTVEGMTWQECSLTGGPDEAIAEPPQDGSDNWRRVTSQTFTIWNSPI